MNDIKMWFLCMFDDKTIFSLYEECFFFPHLIKIDKDVVCGDYILAMTISIYMSSSVLARVINFSIN